MCCVYLYKPGIVFKVVQFRNKRNWIKSLCSMHSWQMLFSLSQEWGVAHYTHMLKEISLVPLRHGHLLKSDSLRSDRTQFTFNVSAQNNRVWRLQHSPRHNSQFHHIIKCWVGKYYVFMIASIVVSNEKHMVQCTVVLYLCKIKRNQSRQTVKRSSVIK